MIINNLYEARKLVQRYKSITLKEIRYAFLKHNRIFGCLSNPANFLTGFGRGYTCPLCLAVSNCDSCLYAATAGEDNRSGGYCRRGENLSSYYQIKLAGTPRQLLKAFRNRARHIEKLLKEIESPNT